MTIMYISTSQKQVTNHLIIAVLVVKSEALILIVTYQKHKDANLFIPTYCVCLTTSISNSRLFSG